MNMIEKEKKIFDLWCQNRIFRVDTDRLRKRKSIYTSFPTIKQNGFTGGDVRGYLLADTYARYYRMNGYNVLYNMGFNNLSFSSYLEGSIQQSPNDFLHEYQDTLKALGIGYDYDKEILFNDATYIEYLQKNFLELFKNNYISYKNKEVYVCENKIYHDFEVKKVNDVIMNDLDQKVKIKTLPVFVLNIKDLTSKIAECINNLNILSIYKHDMLKYLCPHEYLSFKINLDNNTTIEALLDKPEYMGGICFISLNPDFMDVSKYSSVEEQGSIMNYLFEDSNDKGVFSGLSGTNPLTNNSIPVFISKEFKEPIHIGIPAIYECDVEFSNLFGLDMILLLDDNNKMINSDFLTGLSCEVAHNKIISSFVFEDMAKVVTQYEKSDITISSLDKYGCIIPLLFNPINENLVTLKDHLPITFSDKYRPIIPNEDKLLESGNLLPYTLNKLFTNGFSFFSTKLYDSATGILNPFKKEGYQELSFFGPADFYIIRKNELFEQVFMPIVFSVILGKNNSLEPIVLAKKIIIEESTYDSFGSPITKQANNYIHIKDDIKAFSSDATRLFFLSESLTEPINYDINELSMYHQGLVNLKKAFQEGFVESSYALELPLYQLVTDVNNAIAKEEISKILGRIFSFMKNTISKNKMTRKQALTLLTLISIFMPYTAEEIYQSIFNGKHSIFYLEYPKN